MKRFLVVSCMVLLAHVHGAFSNEVTVQELLQNENIVLEELAPGLWIACTQNDRAATIEAAVALRHIPTLEALLYPLTNRPVPTIDELKTAAVHAAEHGYAIMTCSSRLKTVYNNIFRASIYNVAFWAALKAGHIDTAVRLADLARSTWNPLQSFIRKIDSEPEVIEDFMLFLPAYTDFIMEENERLVRQRVFVNGREADYAATTLFEQFYQDVLSCVEDVEKRAELIRLFVAAFLVIRGSDLFVRYMSQLDPSQLSTEALARLFASTQLVAHFISNRDVMGIICEYIDPENSRWLRGIYEITG